MDNKPEWMNDPLVSGIDRGKLEFLSMLVGGGQGKGQKEMMPYMMMMMKQAKAKNVSFTPDEVSAVVAAVKKYSSQEEVQKIDEVLKKANGMSK